MKLKSIRRTSIGNQMRIQTIVPDVSSEMVTCWVDQDGVANMLDHEGVALVAPEFDSTDKVTQSN